MVVFFVSKQKKVKIQETVCWGRANGDTQGKEGMGEFRENSSDYRSGTGEMECE